MMPFTAAEGVVDLTVGGLGDFNASMGGVQKTLDSVGRGLSAVSRTARNVFLGLSGAVGASVALAARQEQAEARLAAVVRATGNAAGFTTEQLLEQANALQAVTTFGDEVIIKAQGILATFKEITGDEFEDVTEAVLDVAQLLDNDAKQGAIQFGKALNDPIKGVTALADAGIQFTDAQREQIKNFIETNQLAKAQRVILEEVKGQFGGVARAAALTDTGAMLQLKNLIGAIAEDLGKIFLPMLGRLARAVASYVPKIREWIAANKVLIKTTVLWTAKVSLGTAAISALSSAIVGLLLAVQAMKAIGATLAAVGAVFLTFAGLVAVIMTGLAIFLVSLALSDVLDDMFDLSDQLARIPIRLKALRELFLVGLGGITAVFVASTATWLDVMTQQFQAIFNVVKISIAAINDAWEQKSIDPVLAGGKALLLLPKTMGEDFVARTAARFEGIGDDIHEAMGQVLLDMDKELALAAKILGRPESVARKDLLKNYGQTLSDALAPAFALFDEFKAKLEARFKIPDVTLPKGGGTIGAEVETNLRPSFTSLEGAFKGLQTAGTKRETIAQRQLTEAEKQVAATRAVEAAVRGKQRVPVLAK